MTEDSDGQSRRWADVFETAAAHDVSLAAIMGALRDRREDG